MDDLIAWLRQQLTDDEKAARAVPVNEHCVPPAHWSVSTYDPDKGRVVMGTADDFALPTPEHAQYVARFDPAAVLADITAKKELLTILAFARDAADTEHANSAPLADAYQQGVLAAYSIAVQNIARAYRHRPGWRTEWEA